MLIVAHAGQGDHHGTVQGQDGSTEPPALAPPALGEAVQLARQVERRETKAREGDCQRETAGVTPARGQGRGRRASWASWLPPCTPPGQDHSGTRQRLGNLFPLEPRWYSPFSHENDLPGLRGIKIRSRSRTHSLSSDCTGTYCVLDGHYSRCEEPEDTTDAASGLPGLTV